MAARSMLFLWAATDDEPGTITREKHAVIGTIYRKAWPRLLA